MEKKFFAPPLPFCGNKRNFVGAYREALKEVHNVEIVVDLFGGSGLLARVAKDTLPHCRVIYNDFDYYTERLENIPHTNVLLHSIRPLLADVPHKGRIPNDIKEKILDILAEAEKEYAVDYVTISSTLLFSGNWAKSNKELSKDNMYNSMVRKDYACATYLDGLEVTHCDYRELFDEFKTDPKVLFIIDPPYLQTDCSAYNNYWKLKDYLDVISLMKETKYIMFSSDKSQIVELCEWINHRYGDDIMNGAQIHKRMNRPAFNCNYTDIMLTRF